MWQYPGMEHIRVGDHQPGCLSNTWARARGSIAIVYRGNQFLLRATCKLIGSYQIPHRCQLVLSQGFGRKEEKGAGLRVFKQPVNDWQAVAQGLTASGACHNNAIPACLDVLPGSSLVDVQAADASLAKAVKKDRVQTIGER